MEILDLKGNTLIEERHKLIVVERCRAAEARQTRPRRQVAS
jgi:hypothetical protein